MTAQKDRSELTGEGRGRYAFVLGPRASRTLSAFLEERGPRPESRPKTLKLILYPEIEGLTGEHHPRAKRKK